MTNQHTQGPWKWWTKYTHRLASEAGSRPLVLSAYVGGDGVAGIQVSTADMQLIAAAPDLLRALEFVEKVFRMPAGTYPQSEINALHLARAAIAKAKGEA